MQTVVLVTVDTIKTLLISPEIFRAYDIRGIVDQHLSPAIVKQIGQAIGTALKRAGGQSIVVGRDGRVSGERLSEALIQGLLSTGAAVIDVGMVPTPLLYFATHYFNVSSGVMITGSHNPREYNGFKIVIDAKALYGPEIQGLYQSILAEDFCEGVGTYTTQDIIEPYLDWLEQKIQLPTPLKIVVDAGNGVSGLLLEKLYKRLGCSVIPLFCEVDGEFPNHHPDPGQPENLKALQEAVLKHEADCGLAFDGDGDRLGVVDSQAQIIWPDRLLMLFAQEILLEHPKAPIIFDVKCSQHLRPWIDHLGGIPCMWKTGHSLIKAKMREIEAPLAGEMSGHFFFKACYGFDDALYAGAYLLAILGKTMMKSADQRLPVLRTTHIFEALPNSVSTPEIMLSLSEEEKFFCVERLREYAAVYAPFEDAEIHAIDGLRVDFKDGFGLVRCSNTSPNLICRFEGLDVSVLSRIQADFSRLLQRVRPHWDLPF